jgi:hydroxypyruvate reductase 2
MFQAKLEQISSPRTDRLIAKISVENMTPPPPSSDETPLVLLAQALFPEFAARSPAADADAAETAEGRVLLVGLKPVTDEHLAGFPALELVVGISVGVDHVDLAACRRRGLSVTNAGAAFAVGLVVTVFRRVAAAWDQATRRPGKINIH